MAAIAPVFGIISGIGQVFSAFSGAGSASNAGYAQQQAAQYNAAVARNNAIAAQRAAEANAKQQETINRAHTSQLQANLIKSGVLMEGTPLMLISQDAAQGELSKEKILHQGQVQAMNYMNEANMQSYQGDVAAQAGENRASGLMTSGIFSGFSTVGSSLLRN